MIKKTILMLLVLVGGVMQMEAKTIYLKPGVWKLNADYETFSVWAFDSSTQNDKLIRLTAVNGTNNALYSVTIDDSYGKISFLRHGGDTEYEINGYPKTVWNYKNDIVISKTTGNYYYSITGWTDNSDWHFWGTSFKLYYSTNTDALGGTEADMDTDNGYEFSASIDNEASGSTLYSMIVPLSSIDNSGNIDDWANVLYPVSNNYYTLNFANMSGDIVANGTKRWEIKGNKAVFTITFNFATFTWTCTPYISRPITANSELYITFSSDYDVAIPSGITAYYGASKNSTTVNFCTFTQDDIDADDAAFLKAEVAGTYKFYPASTANPGVITGNLLKKPNDGTVPGGNYVFAKQDAGLGFYKVSADLTGQEGKAYLNLSGNAPMLSIEVDGETTGLKVINLEEKYENNGKMFDLQGRRVAEPTKGVYIVNGKKVIIK